MLWCNPPVVATECDLGTSYSQLRWLLQHEDTTTGHWKQGPGRCAADLLHAVDATVSECLYYMFGETPEKPPSSHLYPITFISPSSPLRFRRPHLSGPRQLQRWNHHHTPETQLLRVRRPPLPVRFSAVASQFHLSLFPPSFRAIHWPLSTTPDMDSFTLTDSGYRAVKLSSSAAGLWIPGLT